MDVVRARGQDPETCRELFILAAEMWSLSWSFTLKPLHLRLSAQP